MARKMRLTASGIEVQCIEEGRLLHAPAMMAPLHAEAFARVCMDHKLGPDLLLRLPKVTSGAYQLDEIDRVELGAALLSDLVTAGL